MNMLYPTIESEFLAAIVFILLQLSWITRILNRKRKHPPLPPGPLGLPIIGNLLSLDPELHSYFADLARAHGPILSLQLGTKLGVVITSPVLAKQALKDHDITFANRDVPAAGRAATYGGCDIGWTEYGPEWRFLRKVCVRELLGASNLGAVYGIRRREMRQTILFLSGQMGQPVNVGEQMFYTALNVVTGMLWGGTLQAGEQRARLGKEFRHTMAELTELLALPNVSDFFPVLARFDLQGIEKKMKVCAKKLDAIFEEVIDLRLRMNEAEKEKDFLQVLLQMMDNIKKGGGGYDSQVEFSISHLKALLMDMVTGGTDTTSSMVEFAMAEILNKPEVLKKVQQEIDTVIGNDNIVEEHHIYKLPYLQAVMKETLRLHPVLPLLMPHCPNVSCILGGYTIPKGSRVFFNVWAIHRDPSIWPNPLEFDPERFLNAKFDFSGNDFNYFPFGSGRRLCAGIAMAERMVLLSLASLLHSFDWKLPDGEELDLQEKFGLVLSKKIPLMLIPEARLCNPALYE